MGAWNLSFQLSVVKFGVGAVDTSVAREMPFVVTYDCTDSSGNQAITMRRRVYVGNPCSGQAEDGGDERICPSDDPTVVICSVNDLCPLVPHPLPPTLARTRRRHVQSQPDGLGDAAASSFELVRCCCRCNCRDWGLCTPSGFGVFAGNPAEISVF